ncbi:hypothetical protein [Conexibacter woesei]|uniref:Uncharacterized protein n=1 Tax=Conexibacter woesei (strain DSM 14684 / CCUG 47730 / CIP 108061 / JCM 11494 / NBRC 100937 / ID131577) TaxID=469383 RepID=D3F186_CONWI|nr:hypothetical protein [Conexibacter woesei]ADB50162.1 hypothetical protein Cwoe_1735 [Conexibacter woesei DSM 14684]
MAAPAWAPTPDQVAAILHARTRGRGTIAHTPAAEQGRFTTATRPTLAQVGALIELACADVAVRFPGRSPCSDTLRAAAANAAAYRAAQLVEVSFFPERTAGEGTAFAAFGELWRETAAVVAAAIVAGCPLDGGGPP